MVAGRMLFQSVVMGLVWLCVMLCPSTAIAQSAFTYQGQITTAGGPAVGTVDLRLRLFDAAIAGAQVGPTISLQNQQLINGVFTAELDFGLLPFTPNQMRWLEIEVAQGAVSAVLQPRQPLTAAPLALNTRGLFVDTTGRVGILTSAPAYGLDVRGSFRSAGSAMTDAQNLNAPSQRASGTFWQSFTAINTGELKSVTLRLSGGASAWNGTLQIFAGEGTGGTALSSIVPISGPSGAMQDVTVAIPAGVNVGAGLTYTIGFTVPIAVNCALSFTDVYAGGRSGNGAASDLYFITTVAPTGLVVTEGGRAGVGTTTPTAALDVRGDIKLAPGGDLFAAGGEENLRIVRGTVTPGFPSGLTILAGSGFSGTLSGLNVVSVTFAKPFSGVPSVTASASDGFVARVENVTATGFSLRAVNQNGNSVAVAYNFIAVGPR